MNQCVACLGPLGTDADFETFMCKVCKDRKDASELKNENRVFEWKGVLSDKLDLSQLDEYIGQHVRISVYLLTKDPVDNTQQATEPIVSTQANAQGSKVIAGEVKIPTSLLQKLTE